MDALKDLLKQPYWVIALIAGVLLVAAPSVTVDKTHGWSTHPPDTFWLFGVGIGLLIVSIVAFVYTLRSQHQHTRPGGLDLSVVHESGGDLYTEVAGCEIRVRGGLIQDFAMQPGVVVVLPANEYFDDDCINDPRSALGAFVAHTFAGQVLEMQDLIAAECRKRLGPTKTKQKTQDELAESYGAGRCLLLMRPLGREQPIALVTTTTQQASEGLVSRISYLFNGMRELAIQLADARLTEVVMPLLGAGHGSIDKPLALVGLLLALAEAARHGQGGQRFRKATVVLFRPAGSPVAEVDPVVVRRTLALIASRD